MKEENYNKLFRLYRELTINDKSVWHNWNYIDDLFKKIINTLDEILQEENNERI